MFVKQLDHINLSVNNFRESAEWYGRVFGFEVVEQGLYAGKPWGVLRSGDAMLCIYEDGGRTFLDGEELRARGQHGVNHFALRITDRKTWEETVTREKIAVDYGGAVSWPHSTAWYVSDPTGYTIEVSLWEKDQIRFGTTAS